VIEEGYLSLRFLRSWGPPSHWSFVLRSIRENESLLISVRMARKGLGDLERRKEEVAGQMERLVKYFLG